MPNPFRKPKPASGGSSPSTPRLRAKILEKVALPSRQKVSGPNVVTIFGPKPLDRLYGFLTAENLIHDSVATIGKGAAGGDDMSPAKLRRTPLADASNVAIDAEEAEKELRSLPRPANQQLVVVELTGGEHGRKVKGMIELSERGLATFVCCTNPDDGTEWNPSSTVPPTPTMIENTTNRMLSEIQIGIGDYGSAGEGKLPTSRVLAGAIGPLYLRYTTGGSEINGVDVARIKVSLSVSNEFGGLPLLFFWNYLHPATALERTLALLGMYGTEASTAKTCVFNPLVRLEWAKAGTASKATEVLQYDLASVYKVLQAGCSVGFTCGGCGVVDYPFEDHCTAGEGGSGSWVGKSPIASPSDLLRIVHFLVTVHPPKDSAWVCAAAAAAEADEGAAPISCQCLDKIKSRILLSTGLAFKSDLSACGGGGLDAGLRLADVFKTGGGKVDFWRNAAQFFSFQWKPPDKTADKAPPTFSCHICGKEIQKKSEVFEKHGFVYCSMKCLNEHRKQKNPFGTPPSAGAAGGASPGKPKVGGKMFDRLGKSPPADKKEKSVFEI